MLGRGTIAPALPCSILARLAALACTMCVLARAFTALAAACPRLAWGFAALVALSAGLASRGALGKESRG